MKTTSSKKNRREASKRQRLLVAIDFSDSSAAALQYAAKMASRLKTSLLILHVVPANYGLLEIGREAMRDLDESQQRHAAEHLRALTKTAVDQAIEAKLEVRVGIPADEIVAAAAEAKCDVIVLSTHGHGALDRLLLGSVADRVIRMATCPVLLVPPVVACNGQKEVRPAVLRLKPLRKRAAANARDRQKR